MGRHEPDEADRAGDRDRRPGPDGARADDDEPRPRDVDAEARCGLLAERERAQRPPGRQQQRRRDGEEGRREDDMHHRAVLERAEEPEHDLGDGERDSATG